MDHVNAMPSGLFDAVRSFGASDVAIARANDFPGGLPFGISVAVRLSDAIIDEIDSEPTYTYFNHYRSVNFLIDQILLRTGLWLQERGARYITAAASQSVPGSPFSGRYSHKKAACHAGMGCMGRSNLFLHREWGARVRLGTLFTDWPGCLELVAESYAGSTEGVLHPSCASCGVCATACPSGAIGDGQAFDPARCSEWMKKRYQHVGRGAVCGICMRVCPLSKKQ